MLYLAPLLASAAFNTAPAAPQLQASRAGVVNMGTGIKSASKSLPFLTAPKCQSSGIAGAEAGFDPLYLSDFFDIKWMREAELKHGRICMLAATGIIAQELWSLPNYPGYSPNAVEAFSSVPAEGMAQILLFIIWLEFKANDGKFTMMDMFEDPARVPGAVAFGDPLKFGENKETRARLELAELKNGRLAMLAFSGMLHQIFVTGKPVLASLGDIFAPP